MLDPLKGSAYCSRNKVAIILRNKLRFFMQLLDAII